MAQHVAAQPSRLDPSHRLESGPIRWGVQPVEVAAEGIAPNLNAAMILLNRFLNRQGAPPGSPPRGGPGPLCRRTPARRPNSATRLLPKR